MSSLDDAQQHLTRYGNSPSSTEIASEKPHATQRDHPPDEEKNRDSTASETMVSHNAANNDLEDATSDIDTLSYSAGPPSLNYTLRTHGRERYIVIFFMLLFIEAGILPLILFYALQWGAHLSVTKNLAIITSLIGTVSGLKITQRTYQLWFRDGHESRRPIGSGRYGVDTFHVLVSIALFGFFVPLIIGSSLTPASPRTVAMALPCVQLAFCIPLLLTGLFDRRLRLPIRVSSLPPSSPLPPLTYTMVEDIVAVDGGGGLAFRHAWAHRYQTSIVIRRLLRNTAIWWGASGLIVAAALLAAAWTAPENTAYGLGYGMPWLWALVGAAATVVYVHHKLIEERERWPLQGECGVHRDVQLRVQLQGAEADREVERQHRRAERKRRQMRGVDGREGVREAKREGVECRDYVSSGSGSSGEMRGEPLPERNPTPEGRPHTPPLSPRAES